MTETQEIKMQLLDKFGISDEPKSVEFCRKAYEFITEGETKQAPANTVADSLADGIYYVLADGSVVPFIPDMGVDGNLDGSQVKYVGIKWGSRSLKVTLHDAADGEEITLTSGKDTTKYDGYKDNYLDAVADWNGKANTEHLKAIGLNKGIELADGEYIPSLGEMYLIYLNRKALNQALELIGGDPIKGDWYWTSTERSAPHAWYLYLSSGYANLGTKASDAIRVRPVSAFIS
jgi:hypothetical protein